MTQNVLRMMCPNLNCRTILSVPDTARGKTVKCRNCGAKVSVPKRSEPAATDKKKSDAA